MKNGSFFAIIGAIVTVAAIVAGVLYYLNKKGKLRCHCFDDELDDDLMEYIEGDEVPPVEEPAEQEQPQE